MRVRSTLPNGDFYIHITVLLNMIVLVCVLTLLSADIVPRFGFSVRATESRFLMENMEGERYIVAVTAGENPVVFLNKQKLDGGIQALSEELDKIADSRMDEGEGETNVVLVLDRAVSRAMEQRLVDMVLSRSMSCSIASEPAE